MFELGIDLVWRNDESVVAVRAAPVELRVRRRFAVYNFHRRLTDIEFRYPGAYEFRLAVRPVLGSDDEPLAREPVQILAREELLLGEPP